MILYILLKGDKMGMIILSITLMNIIIFIKRKDIFTPVFIYNTVWIISSICTSILIKKITLDIPFFIQLISFLFILFFIHILYQELYKISILSGNTGDDSRNISSIISYARYGRTHYNITLGRKVANILRLNYAISTVFGIVLINKILYKNLKKRDIVLIGIEIFSIGICSFSGGRTDIINQLIILLGFYIIEYTKIYRNNLKLLKIIIVITIILVLLFILQGIFLLNRIDILDNIYLYLGSPIVALNEYLNGKVDGIKDLYFGSNTFMPLYGFLSHFINIENNIEFFPPIKIMKSNVYTSIFPYLIDFGILGTLIFQFIKGLIFKKMYFSILKSSKLGIYYFLFLSILPTIVFSFFDEMLTRKLNSVIVIIIIEFILFKILVKKSYQVK